MQRENYKKGAYSIKPYMKKRDGKGRAIPENNEYLFSKYKSYSIIYSTEVGHST